MKRRHYLIFQPEHTDQNLHSPFPTQYGREETRTLTLGIGGEQEVARVGGEQLAWDCSPPPGRPQVSDLFR
jgi:hypothetical protein